MLSQHLRLRAGVLPGARVRSLVRLRTGLPGARLRSLVRLRTGLLPGAGLRSGLRL